MNEKQSVEEAALEYINDPKIHLSLIGLFEAGHAYALKTSVPDEGKVNRLIDATRRVVFYCCRPGQDEKFKAEVKESLEALGSTL